MLNLDVFKQREREPAPVPTKKVDVAKLLAALLAAVDSNMLFPDAASKVAAKQAIREGFAAES